MALSRRNSGKFQTSIWPGFVDAMTGLVLVMMFVLTIFMVVQFALQETIKGQSTILEDKESELSALSAQIVELGEALGFEKRANDQLLSEMSSLSASLAAEQERTNAQDLQIGRLTVSIAEFEAQVTTLLASRRDKEMEFIGLQDQAEILNQELIFAREEIDAQLETARLAAVQREVLEHQLAEMRASAQDTENTLEKTLALLVQSQNWAETLEQSKETIEAQKNDLQSRLTDAELEAAAATALREKVADLQASLSDDEADQMAYMAAMQQLKLNFESSQADLDALTLTLANEKKQAEQTLILLAAANAAKDDLENRLEASLLELQTSEQTQVSTDEELARVEKSREDIEAQLIAALAAKALAEDNAVTQLSEFEQQSILLAQARERLSQEKAVSTKSHQQVEMLRQQMNSLKAEIVNLSALLDDGENRAMSADAELKNLGARLNIALADAALKARRVEAFEKAERQRLEAEAQTLELYKSEFLAQVRTLLEGRDGVRLVGDRFVFSSEVLFAPGRADLSEKGRVEIGKVAKILSDISADIPDQIDWVIQVDGHTDNVPVGRSSIFNNNWELSQARALSVVIYMVESLGLPPKRLSANGYGEYQPLNTLGTAQARAQNRRIEIKFTEK